MKNTLLRDPLAIAGGTPAAPVTTPTSAPTTEQKMIADEQKTINTVTTIVHKIEIDASGLAKTFQAHHLVSGILIGVAGTLIAALVIHLL